MDSHFNYINPPPALVVGKAHWAIKVWYSSHVCNIKMPHRLIEFNICVEFRSLRVCRGNEMCNYIHNRWTNFKWMEARAKRNPSHVVYMIKYNYLQLATYIIWLSCVSIRDVRLAYLCIGEEVARVILWPVILILLKYTDDFKIYFCLYYRKHHFDRN